MNVSGVIFFPSRVNETKKQKKKFCNHLNTNLLSEPIRVAARYLSLSPHTVAVADSFELVTPHQLAPGVFQICIILQLLI